MKHKNLKINIEIDENGIISIFSPVSNFYGELYIKDRKRMCEIINNLIDAEVEA